MKEYDVMVVKKTRTGTAWACYNPNTDKVIWKSDYIMADRFSIDEAKYIVSKFGGEIEE